VLEIKDFSCGYGSKVVLRDIACRIGGGEFVGIIGPNGCGKTTLLRAISRLMRPYGGRILFKGEDIWSKNLNELARQIAVVSQNPPLGHMTVEEFIFLGRIPYRGPFQFLETKSDISAVRKSMALTGTGRFSNNFLDQMSGGERQLAVIARALAQEPGLFLLDEPTAHLDITHQVQILDLLRKLNREEGMTILTVLHDLNLAGEYCDRLILVNEGKIFKDGRPDDVLDYRIIEDVYKTVVIVKKNPMSSRPYMLLVSQEEKDRRRRA
jgi:iron complex transport system ATP-binding protein